MSSDLDAAIGAKLRFYRTAQGMSQTTLGTLVGLTFQQIQKYENGSNRVSTSRLIEIAKHLNFSMSAFFDGIAEEPSEPNDAADALMAAIASPYAAELVLRFSAIKDTELKRQIAQLMKTLASH